MGVRKNFPITSDENPSRDNHIKPGHLSLKPKAFQTIPFQGFLRANDGEKLHTTTFTGSGRSKTVYVTCHLFTQEKFPGELSEHELTG